MPENKYSYNAAIGVSWDPVVLRLDQGVDLRSNPRARARNKLASLTNARFSETGAITQRAGHNEVLVRSGGPLVDLPVAQNDPWVFGLGRYHEVAPSLYLNLAETNQLRGVTTRDDELVAWTGDRLLSYNPSNVHFSGGSAYWLDGLVFTPNGVPAYLPTADVQPFNYRSETPDWQFHSAAQGNDHRVMAYVTGGALLMDVVNVSTGATVLRGVTLVAAGGSDPVFSGGGLADSTSVLWLGGNFLVLFGVSNHKLGAFVLPEATLAKGNFGAARVLLSDVSVDWDVHKIDDQRAVIVHRQFSSGNVQVTFLGPNGVSASALADHTLVTTTATAGVGVGHSAVTDTLCVAYMTAGGLYAGIWTSAGVQLLAPAQLDASTNGLRITVGGWYAESNFSVVWDQIVAGVQRVRGRVISVASGVSSVQNSTRVGYVASRAFTVGEEPFVVVRSAPPPPTVSTGTPLPPQSTYILVSLHQLPAWYVCGAWCRSTAIAYASDVTNGHLPPITALPGQSEPGLYRLFGAMLSSSLVDPASGNTQLEPKSVLLDFQPKLRSAQLGRCTYFAGAVVQQYDGRRMVEAGFINYPWITGATPNALAGSMTPSVVYQYRVYAVARNAQGELTRSAALTSANVTMGVADTEVVLTITSLPWTNRDDVTFEVYRTRANGSTFFQVSSLMPATSPINDRSVLTFTYTDGMSDTDALVRPEDPHQAFIGAPAELLNFPPPGCTTLAAGLERLWFAGGEVPVGHVAASKLNASGFTVGYSPLVGELVVDRAADPVTAIMPLEDTVLVFRPARTLVITGEGPDNLGQGLFDPPRVISSDLGARAQEGCVRLPVGVTFQSSAGVRLITPGFTVVNCGNEVQTLLSGVALSGAVVVPDDNHVRFYVEGGPAAVWDYTNGQWCVHTGIEAAGVVQWKGRAAVARPDGRLWLEDATRMDDAGRQVAFGFRTGELRPDEVLQGSHRFRRVGLAGSWRGPHTLLVRVRYDGAEDWTDEWTWDCTTSLPLAPPDASDPVTLWFPASHGPDFQYDGVYRVTRRLSRQRASSVSFEVLAQNNPGDSFVINELALECGTKPGIKRIAQRTTPSTAGSPQGH